MQELKDWQIPPWIFEDIKPDMLPEPYRRLSSLVGVENVMKLGQEFQGTNVYFPKLDGTIRLVRDKRIRDEYQGGNAKELAKKYGLTETWIRSILNENPTESNQICLFQDE